MPQKRVDVILLKATMELCDLQFTSRQKITTKNRHEIQENRRLINNAHELSERQLLMIPFEWKSFTLNQH